MYTCKPKKEFSSNAKLEGEKHPHFTNPIEQQHKQLSWLCNHNSYYLDLKNNSPIQISSTKNCCITTHILCKNLNMFTNSLTWMHNKLPIFLQGKNPCNPFTNTSHLISNASFIFVSQRVFISCSSVFYVCFGASFIANCTEIAPNGNPSGSRHSCYVVLIQWYIASSFWTGILRASVCEV
jgi:hypothetical protein